MSGHEGLIPRVVEVTVEQPSAVVAAPRYEVVYGDNWKIAGICCILGQVSSVGFCIAAKWMPAWMSWVAGTGSAVALTPRHDDGTFVGIRRVLITPEEPAAQGTQETGAESTATFQALTGPDENADVSLQVE